jgi:hypothetical protein
MRDQRNMLVEAISSSHLIDNKRDPYLKLNVTITTAGECVPKYAQKRLLPYPIPNYLIA